MPRLLSALNEWLELRARVRDERQFHLDRAAADLRALGHASRAAKRMARTRFGGRRNSQTALRELGGDLTGLARLFRVHGVWASPWLQPAVLFSLVALLFSASPSRREILEGMLGRTLGPEDHSVISLSVRGAGPASPGITLAEFEALQSMATVTRLETFGPHQVVGRPVNGVALGAVTSEAGMRTGNRDFYAAWVLRPPRVMTSPAKVIWLLIAVYGMFFLSTHARRQVTLRWLLYAGCVVCLHLLASILTWALASQLWDRADWKTPTIAGLSFWFLVVAYILAAAVQCLYWWHDLRHRCPICLSRLLLSWTQGDARRILLRSAVTESVCAHGHGVLIESRWSRDFRRASAHLTVGRSA